MIEETGYAESTDSHYGVVDVRKISVRRRVCAICRSVVANPCQDDLEAEFCERNPSSGVAGGQS